MSQAVALCRSASATPRQQLTNTTATTVCVSDVVALTDGCVLRAGQVAARALCAFLSDSSDAQVDVKRQRALAPEADFHSGGLWWQVSRAARIYARTHAHAHTHTHTHARTHAHTYSHRHTHTHMHTYFFSHSCTHTRTYNLSLRAFLRWCASSRSVCSRSRVTVAAVAAWLWRVGLGWL
jgi:hypothetical protein